MTTVISQGSVATRLRCGDQCDSQFVANFLMNSTMDKFRKSVNICQSYGQKYRGPFFLLTVYIALHKQSLVVLTGFMNIQVQHSIKDVDFVIFCCCREMRLLHQQKISCNDLRQNVVGFLIALKHMHCFIVE